MAEATTHVRVKVSTLARLKREAEKQLQLILNGEVFPLDVELTDDPINPLCNGLSLDALINIVLDRIDSHRRRAKKQRTLRKEK